MVADAPDGPISGNDTIADSSKDFRNRIFNEDCATGMEKIPDKTIDLVMMDPPYKFVRLDGKGAFGSNNRNHYHEIEPMSEGISDELLNLICSKMKKINIYIWCNKEQIHQYLNYFMTERGGGIHMDLLTWHKTNPTPLCSNKYLSDTEYILYFRERGTPLYGTYQTKRKWYCSPLNTADKNLYEHPTVKPLEFVRNMIGNSVKVGDDGSIPIILDPFMGSGTTAVAAKELGFNYVGFELNPKHYRTALTRIENAKHETITDDESIPATESTLDAWGVSS